MAREATPTDVYRMPYEVGETGAGIEEQLEGLLASDEETPEETAEPEGAQAPEQGEDPEESEAEEQPQEQPEEPTFTVKVDGEEVTVTLEELRRGYSRTADYTRKTQQLAEQRKQQEAELEVARVARAEYSNRLQLLEQALQEIGPETPDWDTLRVQDPAEYAARWAEHQQHQSRIHAIRMEQAKVAQAQMLEQAALQQTMLEQEKQRLVEAIPDWKNPDTSSTEKKALIEYAKGLGYTEQELAGVVDHRAMVILRKAWQFDKIASASPTKTAPAKTLQPGSRAPSGSAKPKTSSDIQRAKQSLARSGSVRDAASLIMQMLPE